MCTDFKSDLKMGFKVDMSSVSSCPSDRLVVSRSHHCTFALSGTLFQLPLLTFWLFTKLCCDFHRKLGGWGWEDVPAVKHWLLFWRTWIQFPGPMW